jgi:hypothetical protein
MDEKDELTEQILGSLTLAQFNVPVSVPRPWRRM